MPTLQHLKIDDRNTELPFFPNVSWPLTQSDLTAGTTNQFMRTFSWIQAFFNATELTVLPQLVVWGGYYDMSGNPIVSPIVFAYSGEIRNFKGCAIVSSGTDIRGNIWTSTPIGTDPTANLSLVLVEGGMQ